MDAKTVLREGIERWNAHDREGFLALYDEGITYVDQTTGLKLVGREEFGTGFYDLWMGTYPDNELKDPIVFAEGELVCFHGRFVGTNTGPFRRGEIEMPPTGKTIDAPFAFIAEVREGKVKKVWHYYDRLLPFEQWDMLTIEQVFAQLPVPA